MKTVVFKEESWHGWLADLGGNYRKQTDICAYTRAVMWGVLKLIGAAIVVAVSAAALGDWLAWMTAGLLYGFTMVGFLGGVVCFLVLVALCAAALILLGAGSVFAAERLGKRVTDSFPAEAYRSFKDKVCFRVELK